MAERKRVILDTSVLVNFLRVGRMDLLGKHPGYDFVITDHVLGEIKDHYPHQKKRLNAALKNEYVSETRVSSDAEIAVFAEFQKEQRLGIGECSALAAGYVRGFPVAIDDKAARKHALAVYPTVELLHTRALMISLIESEIISLDEADEIKRDWELNHRFTLRFDSFRDAMADDDGA